MSILIPEHKTDVDELIASLKEREKRKKLVNLIIVAEGDDFGGADDLAKLVKQKLPDMDTRVAILGHIQRGGPPSCMDRLIASRMGYAAVQCLIEGRFNVMVGIVNNKIHLTPLEKSVKEKQKVPEDLLNLAKVLAF
jgi:6-phosphofructokinase 1